jgi:type I restriction enzyme S subunit
MIQTAHIKTDKLLVPALRFTEFDGDFELSKLGNELNLFNGYAFSSTDSCENGVRWVKIADVGINEMKLDSPSFLPSEFKEKHSKFSLYKGDYVVALTRPILGGKLKIARVNDDFDGSLLNQRVGKLESKNDLEYMYCMLQQKSLISRIENRIAGTDPPNLSPNEIATLKTFIPSLPEQQKIASFLAAVDEKIQQLFKKKALLEQYKKGVMHELFSGTLRFKDENGDPYPDWEEKRFFDLMQEVLDFRGRTPLKIGMDWGGDILSLSANNVKNGYIDLEAEGNMGSEELYEKWMGKVNLEQGDIVFTMEAPLGKALLIPDNRKYILSQRVVAFKSIESVNNDFLIQLIWSKKFQNTIERLSTGSTAKGINQKSLKKVKADIPCHEEQQKIATYLSSIDTKIESVNNQITQSQTFKKGLLQQMFV